ncbi:MAG TPA: peptidoglycan DD-metalloendopeptidase family protein [Longimicrobiaceae bacterium]|nr:peptidoglycan DD-metalloendopeptidase family protein [Longimicrobiaceae bacterium]
MSLLVLAAFGASLANIAWSHEISRRAAEVAPDLFLPAAYANPVDVTYEDTLRAGETLSQLLLRAQLAEAEASALLGALQEHQDPRRMRPGSVIGVRRALDDGEIRRMHVRLDADRTLSLYPGVDGWSGRVEEVSVRAETIVLTGIVETSLYRALLEGEMAGIPSDERERIADVLADRIFAWQVDFSRDLRQGDRFRILYERMVRPDGTARSSRVLSVQFNINERDYEAYAFDHDGGVEDYFTRDGESLRTAFLRAPLEYRRISSAFSRSRFHPILRVSRPHNGIDYAANAGTPVRAVGDGVIARAGDGGGYGNLVEIRHTRGYSSRYAHLRGFAKDIRPGVRVKQGDVIGYVGATGLATGPHLHYEFHHNARPVDPNSVRDITGDPVPRSFKAQFLERVHVYVASLDGMSPGVLLADLAGGRESPAGE